jgi:hypothetical protein
MYLHKRKATNNKIAKSCEFTRKVCFFLSSNSDWEKAKRGTIQCLVPKHHLAGLLFVK